MFNSGTGAPVRPRDWYAAVQYDSIGIQRAVCPHRHRSEATAERCARGLTDAEEFTGVRWVPIRFPNGRPTSREASGE